MNDLSAEADLPAVFARRESDVRSYCRSRPTTFASASGSWLTDSEGATYLDFFAGAGTLNYGHNNRQLKTALCNYLIDDGIVHGLGMATTAKAQFLEDFERFVLTPRGLDYKVAFPGPDGTNAVGTALDLARKVTGQGSVIDFTNAFHGMAPGSLAVIGKSTKRTEVGIGPARGTPMSDDSHFGGETPDFGWFIRALDDTGSGINLPAAVIVETVQGEGGVDLARPESLRAFADVCSEHDILLIVDDTHLGCGRTGPFFSFEQAGIVPDIVTLSQAISGYGLPMALTLFRPELDAWAPGGHNATFRGNNAACVTASQALQTYWSDDAFTRATVAKAAVVREGLDSIAEHDATLSVRGRGMAQGLKFADTTRAAEVSRAAFDRHLLVETSGPADGVVELLPPLTITDEDLATGLDILADAVTATARN